MSSIPNAIFTAAQSYGVDPSLALEVAIQESNLNQSAVGTSGEIGVFQLMPATAAQLGVNPSDLAQNIQGGVMYLAQLMSQFGDESQAVAAYNCGPTCVQNAIGEGGANWLQYVPASTQAYVAAIMANVSSQYTASVPGMPGSASSAGSGTPLESGVASPSISVSTAAWILGFGLLAIWALSMVD
jgi:soluble lytic murein transglycosylase-like protein